MIAKLLQPVTAVTFSLLLSVGLGVSLSWRVLSDVMAKTAIRRPATQPAELKQKGWDFWTIEIENLATELKEERLRLKKQSELLDQRSARVAAEEKEFGKLRADVEALRKQIADRVIEISADETKNVRSLAATYTTLTPRAAVAIFREMDDSTAVKILSVMKADAVGPIFEEMSRSAGNDASLARRAALLSEKLRLMKASKPTTSS
jgi:flagellar motility protein MotE (MotC chaperone)